MFIGSLIKYIALEFELYTGINMILIKSSIELKQNSLTNFLLDFPKLEITNSFIELIENFSFSKISSFAFSTASELSSTLSKGIDFGAIFAKARALKVEWLSICFAE